MKVNVSLKSADLSKAVAKAGKFEKGVRSVVTIAAREDTKPYVPFLDGPLQGSAETESKPEEGLLIYGNASVPYARAQYYGLPNKTWPGTCMQWFDPSKAANMRKWERMAQEEADRIAGS